MKVRSLYDKHPSPGIACTREESMTQQHLARDTNINVIVQKFLKTGVMPQFRPGHYGDATQVQSLHDALQLVKQGEADFMLLPAELRRRFDDNPVNFMQFVNDPKNLQEGHDLGLWKKIPPGAGAAAPLPANAAPVAAKSASSGKKKVTTTVVEEGD